MSTARIEGEREHCAINSYIRFVVVNGDTD